MKIQVTQEHIDKGKPRDPCNCPIALAIKDAIGGIVRVSYDACMQSVTALYLNNWHLIGTVRLAWMISNFDNHGLMLPMEIEIPYEETKASS